MLKNGEDETFYVVFYLPQLKNILFFFSFSNVIYPSHFSSRAYFTPTCNVLPLPFILTTCVLLSGPAVKHLILPQLF